MSRWRIAGHVVVCSGVANVTGAVLSFLYNVVISPLPPDVGSRADVLGRNLPWFLVYMVAAGSIVMPFQAAAIRYARTPRQVLRVPWVTAVSGAAAWAGAAVIFLWLNWDVGSGNTLACRMAIGIGMAGLVATTLTYLLVERAARPMFAEVLAAGAPRARRGGIHNRLIVTWLLGSAVPLLWVAATLVERTPAERAQLTGSLVYLVVVGLAGGFAVHAAVTHSVADPIGDTSAALRRIGAGDLDVSVRITDRGEVGELQASVNAMTEGLRERRRIEDLFGRFVGPDVARLAIASGTAPRADRCEATVLFVDLVGSTALAGSRPPEQMLALLNELFAAVVDTVTAHGGFVNGFDGDGAICVFGPPLGDADHADRGLRCARALAGRLREIRARVPELDVGIGVSSGDVVAGYVGAASRYEYTVVGSVPNEASRLTDLAKDKPCRVLASAATVARAGAGESTLWQPGGAVRVRGREAPVAVCEPAAEHPAATARISTSP